MFLLRCSKFFIEVSYVSYLVFLRICNIFSWLSEQTQAIVAVFTCFATILNIMLPTETKIFYWEKSLHC